jgi:hypothetical protein
MKALIASDLSIIRSARIRSLTVCCICIKGIISFFKDTTFLRK